jgi:hypothetical protein
MEWVNILKEIPYGKGGMVIAFVLVMILIILYFQDRTQKRMFDHLGKFIDYLIKRGGRP